MRIIAHLDMDAFFAAVEERDKPWLSGKPIVVGSDPMDGYGRGVVSTANYKAREYGIHSAVPISTAWRLSEKAKNESKPAVVFIEPNFSRYQKASEEIMDIIKKYAPIVEEASIDEAYFDLSFAGSFEKAQKICEKIKEEIKSREQLTASIGIGPNKMIAKIASDFKKPNGLTIISEKEIQAFLEPLSIRKIPGIGPKTEEALNKKGIKIIKDLKKISSENLKSMLGKWGEEMYKKARGIDESPLELEHEIKSIGEQETFLKDAHEPGFVINKMSDLGGDVFKRFKQSGFKNFRTIMITIRFADFETISRSLTLKEPESGLKDIQYAALRLLMPFFDKRENPKQKFIRLIGLRIEKLK
ncbi:MAG: DNA polymerase IV [Patescibacteria group bacterium]